MLDLIIDLVDEMGWEDLVEFVSLEDAGLVDKPVDDTVPGTVWREYYRVEQ